MQCANWPRTRGSEHGRPRCDSEVSWRQPAIMTVEVKMPKLGESVVEGTIGRWLKRVGERVERDEPLVEVDTDKVNAEIPSTVSGTIEALLAREGEVVPVGRPIALLRADDVEPAPASGPNPDAISAEATKEQVLQAPPTETPRRPHRHSPAVRRLAAQSGLDPDTLTGTGAKGRVTRKDMEAAIAAAKGGSRVARHEGDEIMPLTSMRRTIAARMSESKRTVPHAWTMVEVDVTSLVRFRESIKEEIRRREGVNLTYLPFVIKAAVEGLREYPIMNSQWDGDRIVLKSTLR